MQNFPINIEGGNMKLHVIQEMEDSRGGEYKI